MRSLEHDKGLTRTRISGAPLFWLRITMSANPYMDAFTDPKDP
jgi:hypothetical protein